MPEDSSAALCCAWGAHPAVLAAAPRLLLLPAATRSRWQRTQNLHAPELQPVSSLALEAPLVLGYRLALGTQWESNWPKQAGSRSPAHQVPSSPENSWCTTHTAPTHTSPQWETLQPRTKRARVWLTSCCQRSQVPYLHQSSLLKGS